MLLIRQNVSFWLLREKTTIVNSSPFVVTIANLLILVATLVANAWAIHIIHNKERSRINRCAVWQYRILDSWHLRLIKWDCLMNMVTIIVVTFRSSPVGSFRCKHISLTKKRLLLKTYSLRPYCPTLDRSLVASAWSLFSMC